MFENIPYKNNASLNKKEQQNGDNIAVTSTPISPFSDNKSPETTQEQINNSAEINQQYVSTKDLTEERSEISKVENSLESEPTAPTPINPASYVEQFIASQVANKELRENTATDNSVNDASSTNNLNTSSPSTSQISTVSPEYSQSSNTLQTPHISKPLLMNDDESNNNAESHNINEINENISPQPSEKIVENNIATEEIISFDESSPVIENEAKYGEELKQEDIQELLGEKPTEIYQSPSIIDKNIIEQTVQPQNNDELAEGEAVKNNGNKKLRLGEQLIELGLLSKDQLEIALQEQRQNYALIGEILVSMDFLTDSALAEVLAETSGTERFNPKTAMLDPQAIAMIPKEVASRNKVIPISIKDGYLQLAMADVYNVLAIDQVRRHLPKELDILPIFCTDSEIQELIGQYYDYESSINGILKEIETGIRENDDSILDGSEEGYVSPTVRLVNALLVDAIKAGASDIHFEPEGTFLRLRYRIDGQMTQVRSFHSDYWSAILVRIKILSEMNIAETRMAQDGRVSFVFMGRDVDFRVATQPTVHGENVVMRLLDKSQALMPLDDLGFSEHNITILKKLLKRPEGIIIVTGPTGSGKTTTLYSILNYINSIDVNIMTLEDPVEYKLPLIRQTNIKEGSMDFLSGIKSLMRQDPDIIFVGEVRDEETALMSVRAAMTGHQVFTTLHTNDAMGAIPRLNDIGIPSHLLSGSLICTLAQRLARTLCKECKEEYLATEDDCKILGQDPNNPPTIYRAKGCSKCNHKGYRGRRALVEILPVDKGMDELIAANAPRSTMLKHSLENGFVPMAEDGVAKVLEGVIDVKELINRIDMTDRM